MKTNIVKILVTIVCVFTSMALSAQCDAKKLAGNWSYNTPEAPAEYQNGTIRFNEKEGVLTAVIKATDGDITVDKITRSEDGKSFKFTIFIAGRNVDLTLTPTEGEIIEGVAYAENQTFPIRFKKIKETKATK